MEIERPLELLQPLVVTRKTLTGPGPSNCSPRVLNALSQPVIGHFHEETFKLMDEIKAGLQYVFQTKNKLTLAVSAAGHGGMEAALSNLIEPGDKVLIAVNGIWGLRAKDIASRYGAEVATVEVEAGQNFQLSYIEGAIREHQPSVFFITQGESSTGVYQPLMGIGKICRKYQCLLVVDTVASLGAVPCYTDAWCIDCVYSGSQKVLGAPPGLAPISFGPRAEKKILSRRQPPRVYYFDMKPLGQYWACYDNLPRVYHHTASTTLLYGLREGLAEIVQEGLSACIARHQTATKSLHKGLSKLGLELFVQKPSARLPTVTTILLPPGCDWKALTKQSLNQMHVEIGAGLGPTYDKVIRIGIMGYNANEARVALVLNVLEKVLKATSKL